MASYGYHSRRGNPRSQRTSHSSTHRTISSEEKKFINGTALNPEKRIILEKGSNDLTIRALDLICPIGMGQRALIVSSAGLGKTTFLKHIANAVIKGYPEMKVYCVLVDERPEEVTDFKRSVDADVYSSSIDQGYENHIKIVNTVISRAFKEAAAGENVLILIDSLTRLARVHNAQSRGGRTLSGGVDSRALEVPRRIFGAARNVEEMGSITIIATVLVDTGSRMDDVIFEEFKGTGNMELVLSKQLAARRIFPAIDITGSSTRRAELLFEPEEYKRLELLRRLLAAANNSVTAMQKMLEMLERFPTNKDFLDFFKEYEN